MAGESLNYSEIKNWYDVFNEVITKYGGNEIASLTLPEQGGKAQPADINNLYNKISEFVADEYLGTQPTLYDTDYSVVSSGSLIIRTATTPIRQFPVLRRVCAIPMANLRKILFFLLTATI